MIVSQAEEILEKCLKRDQQTQEHCRRVAGYAMALCQEIGLDDNECQAVYTAALLHDIGKCNIPADILTKPDRLTSDEFTIISRHPGFSAKILMEYELFEKVISYVVHHHERIDGKGYPYGLKDYKIPLGAKIIAIADSFDAMTSQREYSATKTLPQAVEELRELAGLQFDVNLVEPFINIVVNMQAI